MVTTGSVLNKYVYGGSASSNTGGGVQRNSLMKTTITLAGSTKPSGRASYTSMGRQINGRAVIVNTGGCGHCDASKKTSTLEQILAFLATPQGQAAVQLTANAFAGGISKLASLGHDGSKDVGNTNTKTNTGNAGLSSTLASFTVSFDNIDYEATANDFSSKMKKAKNSQDLYQALQGAKAYRAQIQTRMAGINKNELQASLDALTDKTNGSIQKAETAVETSKKGVETAQKGVSEQKGTVDGNNKAYKMALAQVKTEDKAFNEAKENVGTAEEAYNKAKTNLADARKNYSDAQVSTKLAKQSYENAQANTREARANLDALKGQLTTSTDGAALAAQISQAEAALKAAETAEATAKRELENATTHENNMEAKLKGDDGAEKAFATAQTNLTTARGALTTAAATLRDANQDSYMTYNSLITSTNALETSERTLAEREKTLFDAESKLANDKAELDILNNQKSQLETKLGDYKEMEKALNKLNDTDMATYEKKLTDMMAKEKTTYDDLQAGLNDKNRVKTTKKQLKLGAGDATDDIARDNAIRNGNKAETTLQTNTHTNSPFANLNDLAKQAEQSQNEALLNQLESAMNGMSVEINGKKITKMPSFTGGESYMLEDGKMYNSFDELKKAVQDGTL